MARGQPPTVGTRPDNSVPGFGPAPAGRREFAVRLVMVVMAIIATYVLYELIDLVLLAFAAILVAITLQAAADPLVRTAGMRRGPALAISGTLMVMLIALIVAAFGAEIGSQMDFALERLPTAASELVRRLEELGISHQMLAELRDLAAGEKAALLAASVAADAVGIIAAGVLVIVTGVYLAAQPRVYFDGMLAFVSSARRRAAIEALCLDVSGELRHWLVAQIILMVLVGSLTGIGAWMLGLPAPMALGLIAGLFEFLPYIGPLLTTIPAIALGLAIDIETAMLMLGWIFIVQQLEGLFLTPMILNKAVRLPPAVSLLALVGAGLLLGTAGVLLAAPAAVVGYVIYRRMLGRRDAFASALPADPANLPPDIQHDVPPAAIL
ncbi:AI-2E family transporter [Croceicoccus ponticola]|nr:AI-2E family transporter [Croceicoccus ponticola]